MDFGFEDLVRDGEFSSLGFISHYSSSMLVFIEREEFLPNLETNPNITCVITTPELIGKLSNNIGVAIANNPRKVFYTIHNHLASNTNFYWENYPSKISDRAVIHPSAYIADQNVVIGDNVVVEPFVAIFENTIINNDCIIRSGAKISSIGFEFKRFGNEILHVIHGGGVKLGRHVEIQCNSNVDRAVFGGFTEIGDNSKIDTFVHVGHQSKVGKRCLIAASTVLCGSSIIEDDVWIGPHSTISSEVLVGKGAKITLGSVVTNSIAPNQKVAGNFAIDHNKFIQFIKSIR